MRALKHAEFGIAALLSMLVWLMAPQQLPVSVYKLSLVAMAAVAGYWLDRSLFPYARPDLFLDLHIRDAGKSTGKAVEFFSFTEQHSAEQLSDASRTDQLCLFGASMLRCAGIVAAAMIALGLVAQAQAQAQPVGLQIPARAHQYRRVLTQQAYAQWGLDAPIAALAAQAHQESAWHPWTESTIKSYTHAGTKAAKKAGKPPHKRLLGCYGDMLAGLSSQADANSVRVGFDKGYATFNEFGTKHMPRRGLLYANPETGELAPKTQSSSSTSCKGI